MDKEKKLRMQIIVTLVVAVLLVAGMVGAWAMVLVRPLDEEMVKTTGDLTTARADAAKMAGAKEALETARVKEKRLNVQLAFFRNRYRSFDFGAWDPAKSNPSSKAQIWLWRRLMHEFSYDYGPRLWGEIHGAANASGVSITTLDAIKTEAPPKGPENITIPANGFFTPTGPTPLNIAVTGTLDQILNFLRRIHEGQILMKVGGGLKLDGSSPRVSVGFTLQPYLVARGTNVNLTAAGAAPAAPAGGLPTTTQIANIATTPIGAPTGSAPPAP